MPCPTGIGACNHILAFAEEGLTQMIIAQWVGITRLTGNQILKRHQDTGSFDPGRSSGRPHISTAWQDHVLGRLAYQDRFKSCNVLFSRLSGVRTLMSMRVDNLSIVDWSRWDAGLIAVLLSQNWLQDTNMIDWLELGNTETWLCNTDSTWYLVMSTGLYSIQ